MRKKLYIEIADEISSRIDRGLYRAGDRLPSVRQQSELFGVSISTVLQAYARLQDRRLILSRPQSGYYINQEPVRPPLPAMSRPSAAPTDVSVSELVMEVVQANEEPRMVPFGTALPNTGFPAIRRLHRLLAEKARATSSHNASYAFPPGDAGLRLQLARRAVDSGCAVAPDDVLITSGCQEALVLCLRTIASPGDTIAIESPTFYGVLQAIESLGIKALEIPTHPETGISIEALQLAIEQWPIKGCLLTPGFSNPLGYCMPDERKQALLKLLQTHDLPLIEDDIYGDLGYGGERPRAIKSWDRQGRVLLCSSISKTLDPGMRIGWVLPGRYRQQLQHLKLVSSMATATLPQMAVAAYLEGGGYDRHLRDARNLYRQNRDICIDLVARHFPGQTRVTQPQGGFVAWIELPESVDAIDLYHQAHRELISIAPGPIFSPTRKYQNFIRINYAQAWDERHQTALARLGELATAAAG